MHTGKVGLGIAPERPKLGASSVLFSYWDSEMKVLAGEFERSSRETMLSWGWEAENDCTAISHLYRKVNVEDSPTEIRPVQGKARFGPCQESSKGLKLQSVLLAASLLGALRAVLEGWVTPVQLLPTLSICFWGGAPNRSGKRRCVHGKPTGRKKGSSYLQLKKQILSLCLNRERKSKREPYQNYKCRFNRIPE